MAPPPAQPPTVRHRRLSAELKRLREAAGVSVDEAARTIGAYRTKINRIERGEWKRLRERDLRLLASLYGIPESHADALVRLAREASRRGWWASYSDVLGSGAYTSIEASAGKLRFYSGLLIPGLLQTSSYTEAVLRGWGITDETEIRRRLEARRERQRLLDRADRPTVEVMLDQAAVNKVMGRPTTMAEQILHLIEACERGRATVLLLPDSAGAHAALTGQFAIMEFDSAHVSTVEPPIVFLDSAHNGLFLEEHNDVTNYMEIYKKLASTALDSDNTARELANLASRLTDQGDRR
ncbi:helix-turn-helix domain-containing protein [Nocardiopsis chromatogenes]|uniref:helix-turn-helix domain-containing protein n=1 Tax=Nocardiopsis chromatogenes TaxID=280239 RepID=UPI0003724420|nr:helix-turn-helix transcriptional regulator [Nocardiopsis chromatogenes]